MFNSVKMARRGNNTRKHIERLWYSPNAYRPRSSEPNVPPPPSMPAVVALHRLANFGNGLGATAGDCGVLVLEILTQIDYLQDCASAFDEVIDQVGSGDMRTVAGMPMRDFVNAHAVAAILEAAASLGRYEAYAEYVLRQDSED